MEVSPSLSRRERERNLRRREMLDAAKAVFAEKSYADATVDEIAERAQYGKGTIYLYFKGGKQEILSVLLDELFEAVHRRMEILVRDAESSAGHSRDLLYNYLSWLFQHMMLNHDLFIVSVKEIDRSFAREATGNRVQWGERFDGLVTMQEVFFTIAINRGEIRQTDAAALAHVFIGMVRGYLTMVLGAGVDRDGLDTQASSRQATEWLISLLYDGVTVNTG